MHCAIRIIVEAGDKEEALAQADDSKPEVEQCHQGGLWSFIGELRNYYGASA